MWSVLDQRAGKWPWLVGPAVWPRRPKDRTVNMQGSDRAWQGELEFPWQHGSARAGDKTLTLFRHRKHFSPTSLTWRAIQSRIKGIFNEVLHVFPSNISLSFNCSASEMRSSMLISYLSQCSVHCLYEAIQLSCLGCPISSETAILERQTQQLRLDQHKVTFWDFFHLQITAIIFLSVTSISFVLPSPVTPTSDSYFLIE